MPALRFTNCRPPFKRILLAAGLGLVGAASTTPSQAAPREPVDVGRCVSFEEHDVSDLSIDARLVSNCERSLRCTIEWTLVCDTSQRNTQHSKSFTLRPSSRAAARISAAACKDDDWSVEGLSWSCVER